MELFSREDIIELLRQLNEKQADELQTRVMGEVDQPSQRLAGWVKELAERYEFPITRLASNVIDMGAKVNAHL